MQTHTNTQIHTHTQTRNNFVRFVLVQFEGRNMRKYYKNTEVLAFLVHRNSWTLQTPSKTESKIISNNNFRFVSTFYSAAEQKPIKRSFAMCSRSRSLCVHTSPEYIWKSSQDSDRMTGIYDLLCRGWSGGVYVMAYTFISTFTCEHGSPVKLAHSQGYTVCGSVRS